MPATGCGESFSRIAQLRSTRLRRCTDTPRAYVEPVDRRTSVRFYVSCRAAVRRPTVEAFATTVEGGVGHGGVSDPRGCGRTPGRVRWDGRARQAKLWSTSPVPERRAQQLS